MCPMRVGVEPRSRDCDHTCDHHKNVCKIEYSLRNAKISNTDKNWPIISAHDKSKKSQDQVGHWP